ncbi:hypothetical protein HMPREF0496_0716 [Lentilactobacillus hilgardii ATCC 27305]|nr:hypothetical protein HMPREF0496_0716 [Lentilactobacillus hilgardii ATCC 27305]
MAIWANRKPKWQLSKNLCEDRENSINWGTRDVNHMSRKFYLFEWLFVVILRLCKKFRGAVFEQDVKTAFLG